MQVITFPKLNTEFFTYTATFREFRDYSGCTRLQGTGVPSIITAVISVCPDPASRSCQDFPASVVYFSGPQFLPVK